jgi:predicted dehydrogenase
MTIKQVSTMQESGNLSRRRFLEAGGTTAAAVIAGTLAAPAVLRGAEPTSDPVRLGMIGLGLRGGMLLRFAAANPSCKVLAVCDVYKPHLQKGVTLANNTEVKTSHDYHDLLADPRIEAVIIATPDHWHEQMLLDAAAAGKDVYCEKGWTTSVASAKRMRQAVKDAKIVMQLGHQGRQLAAADAARKMILEGAIGEVTLINLGRYFNGPPTRPPWRWYGEFGNFERPDPQQVIQQLDWQRWLGKIPEIPFNDRHFWHWRCYWPYGTGQAGDLLSHEMDHVQTVLRYGIPDTCVTHAHNAFWKDDREVPDTWLTNYVFEQQNCTVTFEGCMNSRHGKTPEYMGRKGWIVFSEIGSDSGIFEVYNDETAHKPARHPQPEPRYAYSADRDHRIPNHLQDFLNGVRTRRKPRCDEDEAFIESVTLVMSVEAYKRQRLVRWDRVKQEIV